MIMLSVSKPNNLCHLTNTIQTIKQYTTLHIFVMHMACFYFSITLRLYYTVWFYGLACHLFLKSCPPHSLSSHNSYPRDFSSVLMQMIRRFHIIISFRYILRNSWLLQMQFKRSQMSFCGHSYGSISSN